MRHRVFLAVLLSLVLSLSEGNNNKTAPATPKMTTPTTTENDTETSIHPTEMTTPTTTENDTETSTHPTEMTTQTTTENDTETSTHPTEMTTPTTTGMTTASSSATTTVVPGDLCKPGTCGTNFAKCVALHSTHTCVCQYGFYHNNSDCHRGLLFPGVITLNQSYSDSVQSVTSVQYQEVFQNITDFFKNAFTDLETYGQTVIVEIQPVKEGKASVPMTVTLMNLFTENSNVTNETVIAAVNKALEGSSYVSQYRVASYCAVFNCDTQTTECEEDEVPTCKCKQNFSKTEWDVHSCSDCSKDCSAEENKYCVKENGTPKCKCMPNFEEKNTKCVSCPVGYSGEDCKNNSELILIIVGTVFGAIILSLVIAVSVVSVRAKHKQDPEKTKLIKSGYSNPNTSDRQATMFPRVQTTSGHANPGYQPNNPYEMHSSNRARFSDRDYDDSYEMSREPQGFRLQSRY